MNADATRQVAQTFLSVRVCSEPSAGMPVTPFKNRDASNNLSAR
jgi:hypothetical protein